MKLAPLAIALIAAAGAVVLLATAPTRTIASVQVAAVQGPVAP
jgi:hypothetical protein